MMCICVLGYKGNKKGALFSLYLFYWKISITWKLRGKKGKKTAHCENTIGYTFIEEAGDMAYKKPIDIIKKNRKSLIAIFEIVFI